MGWLVTALTLLITAPALATDSLSCTGNMYYLDMSVGSDNIVNSATLRDEKTKVITTFRGNEVETKKLTWPSNEGDFSANRLELVLRTKDGQSFVIEGKGRRAVLHHQKAKHDIDCNWER
jgi:hypothetical protein